MAGAGAWMPMTLLISLMMEMHTLALSVLQSLHESLVY